VTHLPYGGVNKTSQLTAQSGFEVSPNLYKEIKMSQEDSIPVIQSEIAKEYRQQVESKSNKGVMTAFIKALVIPFVAILMILTGAAFTIANFSPAMYTQVKDNIFEKVDFEKLTGRPDSTNKEFLDSWLILNSEQLQGEEIAQQATGQEEQIESQPN